MKLSSNRLRMSNGSIRHFKSAKKRANFERVANAIKHNPKFKARLKHGRKVRKRKRR
jgi:hypothetical protein